MGTLTAKETTVLGGSVIAAGIPTAFQLLDAEDPATSLANAVFEGDMGAARLWATAGFFLAGLALIAAAVVGPFNGTKGQLALALGVASLMMAVVVLIEGGR